MLVLAGVNANLLCRLEPVAVNPDEKDVFARELDRHGADQVVVRVGVRTESRQEENHDRAVIPLRLRERKLLALHRPRFEVRGCLTDLESGERACEDEKDEGGGPEEVNQWAVASEVADFFAKLRITLFGEKPQFKPKASPG